MRDGHVPPKPDPRLVYFPHGASKRDWREARSCGHGCDRTCKGLCSQPKREGGSDDH